MDSFLGAWQGVAIVGIVVGILGSLVGANLKARIDLLLSSVLHRWATRTDVRRKQRAERIELLIDSLKEQMHAQMDKLKSLILSVGLLVGSLGFFIVGNLENDAFGGQFFSFVLTLTALVTALFGLRESMEAKRIAQEIREARLLEKMPVRPECDQFQKPI